MNTLVLVAVLGATTTADAEGVALTRLSMADAVRLAVASSEQVRGAALDIEKARGQIAEARALALPHVEAVMGYSAFGGTGGMYPPQFAAALGDVDRQYTASLMLTQLIYNGGQVKAALRAAALAEDVAERGHHLSRVGAVYGAKLAYAGVLAQVALLDVASESVELAARHLADVRARRAAELVTEFDELQARVDLKNADAQRLRARAGVRMARDGLLRRLGLDLGREVDLVDTLEALAVSAELKPLAAYLELGERLRVELEIARRTEELNTLVYEVSTASLRPTLAGQIGYSATNFVDWFDEGFDFDWLAGLQLKIPVFDGLAVQGKKRQAMAELERSRLKLDGLHKDIERDVRSAYWRVETAREFVASQVDTVAQARRAVELAEQRYRSGLVQEIVRQQSRLGLAQARTNLAQARFELFTAALDLELSSGLVEAPAAGK